MRICSFQEFAHRLGDVLEDTPAPSLALVGHQLHAVPPLLLRLLGEVGGKPRQRLVVSREVGRLEVEMRCKVTLTLTEEIIPRKKHHFSSSLPKLPPPPPARNLGNNFTFKKDQTGLDRSARSTLDFRAKGLKVSRSQVLKVSRSKGVKV